jgi:hypothetical protein
MGVQIHMDPPWAQGAAWGMLHLAAFCFHLLFAVSLVVSASPGDRCRFDSRSGFMPGIAVLMESPLGWAS